MPQLILRYFDAAGNAEPARLALFIGGVEFTDYRISRDKWETEKIEHPERYPLGQVA